MVSETDSSSDHYVDQTLFADQNENVFDDTIFEETGIFDADEIESSSTERTGVSDLEVPESLTENDEAGSVGNQTGEIFAESIEAVSYSEGEHETASSRNDYGERAESEVSRVKEPEVPQSDEGLTGAEDQP
jgi:hypothetical protein